MDEATLNSTIRRLLKEFGVSGHQAVEAAVRAAIAEGRIGEGDEIAVSATLTIGAIGLDHRVDGTLSTKLG